MCENIVDHWSRHKNSRLPETFLHRPGTRQRVGEGFFGGQREEQLPLQERNGTLQDDVLPCTLPLPTPTASLWSLTLVWPHSHCRGDGLEFLIHLFYWDYTHVSPHPFYLVLGAWFRASCVLGKHPASGAHNPTLVLFTKHCSNLWKKGSKHAQPQDTCEDAQPQDACCFQS